MITTIQTIAEQLTEIYFKEEWWHTSKMSYDEAIKYHQEKLDNKDMVIYQENGEVLGYYERYIIGDTCFLNNTYIKSEYRFGKVYKELKHRFFNTLPKNIIKVVGTSQKFSGKLFTRFISKERRNGSN